MTTLTVLTIVAMFTVGVVGIASYLLGIRLEIAQPNFHQISNLLSIVSAGSIGVGSAIFLATGLVSLSLASGIAIFLIYSLVQKQRERQHIEKRVEAIAVFAQSLSDSIGGGKSIAAAIKTACNNPPKSVADEMKSFAINLSTGTFEDAIETFVTDLNAPAGDLLGAHLLQANAYATANLAETLRSISETLNEYTIDTKKVAMSRRKQEFEIKGLSVILVVTIILLFAAAPDLLAVYKQDLIGELKLGAVFGCVFAGWLITDRLTATTAESEFTLRKGTQK